MPMKLKRPILKKYERLARRIMKLAPTYSQMSDEELQQQTAIFRARLAKGATLDSLLPEAFAVACEADKRVLGLAPFFNQITGGIVLYYGDIAEMKTGEGKSLTATLPLYLCGLTGPGNFLVTANAYLANRDAEEMGPVYEWLGLTVRSGAPNETVDETENATPDKAEIYKADIVYTTHSALGFDYLMDNLAATEENQFLHGFHYALVDEIDAVLLDMATIPLVISGAPRVQSNYYQSADRLVKLLEVGDGLDIEESDDTKSAWFTKRGIAKIERFFGIKGLLSPKWAELYRHMVLAMRANYLMYRGRDYVLDDGEIALIDTENGRKLPGMKLHAGLHQAIEAKEGVKISSESRAMASITYQNLFRMFDKLSGMTGTAITDVREFRETYHLDVIQVPTHRPVIRKERPDQLYVTNQEKIYASVDRIKQAYAKRRPVLIETGSVSMSELYSYVLLKEGIPHNLLNAHSIAKEAAIIAEAGQPGAITVATSMAGRGTDIKLGEGVAALGGLLVVGTEPMSSRRIDQQLKGRAGRQGAPGESVFYASLEDKVVLENGPSWAKRARHRYEDQLQDEKREFGTPIKQARFRSLIATVQGVAENDQRSSRAMTLQFDEIFRLQREKIYQFRDRVMADQNLDQLVDKLIQRALTTFLTPSVKQPLNFESVLDYLFNHVDYNYDRSQLWAPWQAGGAELKRYLLEVVSKRLTAQHDEFLNHDQFLYFERLAILKAIDYAWIEQVDNLQQLRQVVNSRTRGAHNPIYEYQRDARSSFEQMTHAFWQVALSNLMLSTFAMKPDGTIDVEFP